MILLLKLAFRNIFRNTRRTLITIAAISLGLSLMIVSNNLSFGVYQDMIRAGISTMAGHVVIQAEGWQQSRESDQVVTQAAARRAVLEAAFPEAVVLPRAFFQGLLTSPQNAVGVTLTAIDPGREIAVSDWHKKLVEGEFLAPDDDGRGVILGVVLADSLQVKVGDKVVLMTQGQEEVSSHLLRVRGLMQTGSKDMDGFMAMVAMPAAQAALEQPDTAHQLSLHLPDPEDYPAATARAEAALAAAGLGGGVEVLGWPQALPEVTEMIRMDRGSNNAILAIIGFIVALGVLNTVLMSVMERIREFGVMLAVGTSPRRLVSLIVLEGFLLGLLAVSLGVALGMLLSWPLITSGLDYSAMMGDSMSTAGVTIDSVVHAAVDWERLIIFSVSGLIMTVLSTLYPALKAARLQPVESMRHT